LGLDASNNIVKNAAACGSGGGGTPGGAANSIQYNNAGAFGGFGFTDASANTAIVNTSATTTAQKFTVYNTWSGGSLPTPTNYERLTFDWTSAANIATIGTESAGTGSGGRPFQILVYPAASAMLDYNLNVAGQWSFKTGNASLGGVVNFSPTAAPNVSIGGVSGSGPYGISIADTNFLGWSSSANSSGGSPGDTTLYRDAAVGTLALADGNSKTTATGFRVYNTTDQTNSNTAPTNFERGVFDWTTTANVLTIGTQKGGTGSARSVAFVGGVNGVPTASNYIFYDRDSGASWDLAINGTFLTVNNSSLIGWSAAAGGSAPSISQDTSFARVAAGLIEANNGTAAGVAFVRLNGVVVASLPACSATYQGARGTVTNASQTFTAGIGAIVAGGGANIVPVFCDGTNWRIG
jgi:hypothetical protein